MQQVIYINITTLAFLLFSPIVLSNTDKYKTINLQSKKTHLRWKKLDLSLIAKIKKFKAKVSRTLFLKDDQAGPSFTPNCGKVKLTNAHFQFNISTPWYKPHHIFIIRSFYREHDLYAGILKRDIIIKNIPYCSDYPSDILQFKLFDFNNMRWFSWTATKNYPYYNGKINRVIFFTHHSKKHYGRYRVNQK